jgi:hypothetical protein
MRNIRSWKLEDRRNKREERREKREERIRKIALEKIYLNGCWILGQELLKQKELRKLRQLINFSFFYLLLSIINISYIISR